MKSKVQSGKDVIHDLHILCLVVPCPDRFILIGDTHILF
jgi:hypothetical protein